MNEYESFKSFHDDLNVLIEMYKERLFPDAVCISLLNHCIDIAYSSAPSFDEAKHLINSSIRNLIKDYESAINKDLI